MIEEWRTALGDLVPFYFAQISPFNYRGLNSALLREAQWQTLSLPKTGMAVTMDIGNLADIHPKNKQEVGRRLALWALAHDYGRDVVYSRPQYKSCSIEGSQVIVQFDRAAGGLATCDGKPPSQFQVAGPDKVFDPAMAVIEGEQIVVSSDNVAAPQAARYGLSNQAMPNLMNKADLPASSFRTDSW